MKKHFLKLLYCACTLSPILLLSGCSPVDWVKDKFGGSKENKTKKRVRRTVADGDWVVRVGDEVIVSGDKFKQEFEAILEERPQLKSMLPLMPNAEKDFARGLGNQEIVTRFIEDSGMTNSSKYKERIERVQKAAIQIVNTEFFADAFTYKKLSDAYLNKFYEENKDTMQGIMISRGGVDTSAIMFDRKTDAENFYRKAKAAGRKLDLEKLVKEAGAKERVQDFKLVHTQSFGVDAAVRIKILALKSFPTVEMISSGDKAFWVVHAKEKKETQYRPFEQIKDGIRNVAEQTEKGKHLQKELDKLTKKYNVHINEGFFQKKTVRAEVDTTGDIKEISDAVSKAVENLPKTKAA